MTTLPQEGAVQERGCDVRQAPTNSPLSASELRFVVSMHALVVAAKRALPALHERGAGARTARQPPCAHGDTWSDHVGAASQGNAGAPVLSTRAAVSLQGAQCADPVQWCVGGTSRLGGRCPCYDVMPHSLAHLLFTFLHLSHLRIPAASLTTGTVVSVIDVTVAAAKTHVAHEGVQRQACGLLALLGALSAPAASRSAPGLARTPSRVL
jgi:hypothetical protein